MLFDFSAVFSFIKYCYFFSVDTTTTNTLTN